MHILFIHQNYPAQFGHIARYFVQRKGFRSTFLSQNAPGVDGGVERIQYLIQGGATPQTHYCSASFENATWHNHAIYEALKARPNIRPDLTGTRGDSSFAYCNISSDRSYRVPSRTWR